MRFLPVCGAGVLARTAGRVLGQGLCASGAGVWFQFHRIATHRCLLASVTRRRGGPPAPRSMTGAVVRALCVFCSPYLRSLGVCLARRIVFVAVVTVGSHGERQRRAAVVRTGSRAVGGARRWANLPANCNWWAAPRTRSPPHSGRVRERLACARDRRRRASECMELVHKSLSSSFEETEFLILLVMKNTPHPTPAEIRVFGNNFRSALFTGAKSRGCLCRTHTKPPPAGFCGPIAPYHAPPHLRIWGLWHTPGGDF